MTSPINNHERKFVKEANDDLHQITDVDQRIKFIYHPQLNGSFEQLWTLQAIIVFLIKVLEQKVDQWPYKIDGVLLLSRVSQHTATKCSPFLFL